MEDFIKVPKSIAGELLLTLIKKRDSVKEELDVLKVELVKLDGLIATLRSDLDVAANRPKQEHLFTDADQDGSDSNKRERIEKKRSWVELITIALNKLGSGTARQIAEYIHTELNVGHEIGSVMTSVSATLSVKSSAGKVVYKAGKNDSNEHVYKLIPKE